MVEEPGAKQEPIARAGVPPRIVQASEQILAELRNMLNDMGRDQRRSKAEFQQVMAMYKQLGGEVHQTRKAASAALPPAPKKATTVAARNAGPGRVAPAIPILPAVPGATPDTVAVPDESAAQPDSATAISESAPAPVVRLLLPKFTDALGPSGKPGVVAMGEEVGYLQQVLKHLGYTVEETEVYDSRTQFAVKQFQKDHGLEVSEVVGADMRTLLNQAITG